MKEEPQRDLDTGGISEGRETATCRGNKMLRERGKLMRGREKLYLAQRIDERA